MTITDPAVDRRDLAGGSIELPPQPVPPRPSARPVAPWTGEPGTAGTVAVVGAGKMGLPLAAQFAVARLVRHRRRHRPGGRRLRSTRAARTSARSRASPSSSQTAHAAGRLRATTDGAEAARAADVVVLIVPVMLDASQQPDHRYMDCGGRLDRAGRPRRIARDLRDDAAGRRHARPVRAAPRGGQRAAGRGSRRRTGSSSPSRPSGCTAAPRSATWRPTRSSSAGSARLDGSRRRVLRRACSTPRSSRCRRPRRPSSRSSPTRPTAT